MAFRDKLAASESGGDYGVVNSLGYTGKYQFGDARLTDFRNATGQNFTMDEFQANPSLQEAAYDWHIGDIDRQLGQYVGTVVNGVPLTQDALRAVAHLGGVGGARRFATSGGAYNPADAYGTSLSDYAGKFGSGSPQGVTPPADNQLSRLAVPPQAQTQQSAPPQLRMTDMRLNPADFMTQRRYGV